MPSQVEIAIETYRKRMLLRDAGQMREMARRWLEVERKLETIVLLLTQETADLKAEGKIISQAKLRKMERYLQLLAQVKVELEKYNRWASTSITHGQATAISDGITSARDVIQATYRDAGKIGAYFDILPVEAVEAMIGFAGDGTPLYRLLMQDYSKAVLRLTQTLIDSVALGRNPRVTAKLMLEDLSGNLNRALTIARTEQLRAYRSAATEQMKASKVVEGWIWRCALQERTCLACLAMDGQRFDLDEVLNDHPNGRCFKQPVIKGLEPISAQSGTEWFAAQSDETQRKMMGPKRYEAWKAGQFKFGDLASRSESDEWGPIVRVAGLEEIGRDA